MTTITLTRTGEHGHSINRITIPCPPWGLDLGDGSRPDTEPDARITMRIKPKQGAVECRYTLIRKAMEEVRDEWG